MVKPPMPSEPILTGVRKTLVEQQGEVTVKDPSTHAARQVLTAVHNNPSFQSLTLKHARLQSREVLSE